MAPFIDPLSTFSFDQEEERGKKPRLPIGAAKPKETQLSGFPLTYSFGTKMYRIHTFDHGLGPSADLYIPDQKNHGGN